jgi:5'-nucleotidase
MSKPLILVTNDDGIEASGIRALVEVAQNFGEVVVVAPDKPQSGQSNSLTLHELIRLKEEDTFPGIEAYSCSGKPVDCVKLARAVVLKDRKIDLCLSGINHGSNASINIIYSGTMSAAMEASLEGINSIGFSLLDYSSNANFEASKKVVGKIVHDVLKNGLNHSKLLNVNIPKLKFEDIKGIKVCRQANANWTEEFIENTDPRGGKYYWMTGQFVNNDVGSDHDIWALENGYVSVVPSKHDLTAHDSIEKLRYLEV